MPIHGYRTNTPNVHAVCSRSIRKCCTRAASAAAEAFMNGVLSWGVFFSRDVGF